MAYESQGIDAVKNTAKLDIGGARNSLEGFMNVLETQPSAQGRVGTTTDIGATTNATTKPKAIKTEYKDAKTMVNAMVYNCLNNRNDIQIDFSKSDNPLLR